MNCPKCSSVTSVTNSRPTAGHESVRRRRQCDECGHRFTTFEVEQIGVPFGADDSDTGHGIARSVEVAALFARMDREDAALAMRLLRRLADEPEATVDDEAAYFGFQPVRAA